MLHMNASQRLGDNQRSQSAIEPIAFSDVESDEVRAIAGVWQKWRGLHAMPAYERLNPRDFGPFIDHASIVRFDDGGDDYSFVAIGDAHVLAYGTSFAGKSLSDVRAVAPKFAKLLKASFDLVRNTCRPYAFHGTVGRDAPEARFSEFETCYLPIAAHHHGAVSHIINAACYVLK